ncbi:hypothetical protein GCM10025868_05250 [Angustibacter aerolatus]|uniref:Uncharacterized protein n=1 Tax=Angustibacter aerolatus TaxID=1162965 RepID=A0ABQ6JAS7_9ACTN|nr:hypothetical protein GCM10025868_05250 [Angustibacter aerolatus]
MFGAKRTRPSSLAHHAGHAHRDAEQHAVRRCVGHELAQQPHQGRGDRRRRAGRRGAARGEGQHLAAQADAGDAHGVDPDLGGEHEDRVGAEPDVERRAPRAAPLPSGAVSCTAPSLDELADQPRDGAAVEPACAR